MTHVVVVLFMGICHMLPIHTHTHTSTHTRNGATEVRVVGKWKSRGVSTTCIKITAGN